MPASHDFFIAVPPADTHVIVARAFGRSRWRVTELPGFGVEVARGSRVATRILGPLALGAFHVTLRIELFGTEDGSAVARLHRSLGRAVVRGGGIGVAFANRAFDAAADLLHAALTEAGVLTGRVANARPAG